MGLGLVLADPVLIRPPGSAPDKVALRLLARSRILDLAAVGANEAITQSR